MLRHKKNRTICNCHGVTEAEVLHVLKRGAKNLDEVCNFTLATTSCGRCKADIKAVIDAWFRDNMPGSQQTLDF